MSESLAQIRVTIAKIQNFFLGDCILLAQFVGIVDVMLGFQQACNAHKKRIKLKCSNF